MNSTGYIYGARGDAADARREARPEGEHGGIVPTLQPAVVKAIMATGVYQVAVLSDDGTEGATIDGVRPFPVADLAVDDDVWLVRWPGNPVPMILQAGGQKCGKAVTEWGTNFDE